MAKSDVEPTVVDALMERLRQEGFSPDVFIDPSEIQEFQLTDKEELVNRPFVIVQVLVKASMEFSGSYVVCRCLDANGERIVFADGSSGIAATLQELLTKYEQFRKPIRDDDDEPGYLYDVAIPVTKGLSKHTYMTKITNPQTGEKEVKSATTFRLNVGR